MGHTIVPDVIDGLLLTLRGYSELSGVEVLDGGIDGSNEADELIAICYSEDNPPVQGATSPAELSAVRRRSETFSVECYVSVSAGDDVVSDVRRRAFTLFGFVEDAIHANPQLGGDTTYVDIRDYHYTQEINDSGCMAQIMFLVVAQPTHRY